MNYLKTISIFSFLLIQIIVLNSSNSFAKAYYISLNGSDKNSGLNISEPFKSINLAIKTAAAGDSILILPGKYLELILINKKNGKPEKPILISGYSNNEKDFPVIDGGAVVPSNSARNFWMTFNHSSWIEVKKIKFVNGWTDPIQIDNSSYISFDSCIFRGARHVIWAKGRLTHHLLVENCFWDQGGEFLWRVVKDSSGIDGWTSMHHGSMQYFNGSIIDFRGTGGSIVIRNNIIKNAFNAIRWRGQEGGYDSNVEIYGNQISQIRDNDFEPETYTYNLYIYHNFSHNVHRTLSVDNVFGGFIYYYGNVITTDNQEWTRQICKGFWKIYGSERNLNYPLYVFNNSFYGCAYAFKSDRGKPVQTKHFNNAYYFLLDRGLIVNKWDPSNEFDYDISNKKWPANLIKHNQEVHGKVANIKYVNPAGGNLRLQNSSPGIDAGKIMYFPELDWKQTYFGNAPDIGAYENGKLVEGPPFHFRIPPGMKLGYEEKPRIVRHSIKGKNLLLFYSDKIDKSSLDKSSFEVYQGDELIKVHSVSIVDDNYALKIQTSEKLKEDKLSISLKKFPLGLNGQQSTYWATTVKIHKSVKTPSK